ncbi:MAG: F0F1 ATP synthase subunit gamma [Alphaproteobacteria bacterium]|nr:F0F1 ATP synthase subunit gamma [Alphaproteobacteria bacterium]
MTLESLNRRIKTTAELRDIVSTMKMLSSVSVGQYERALLSVREFGKTVREGFLGVLLNDAFHFRPQEIKTPQPNTLIVAIGTDNGLVGRFNKDVLTHAAHAAAGSPVRLICVGKRMGLLARARTHPVDDIYPISNSLKEIMTLASMILVTIDAVIAREKIEKVMLCFNQRAAAAVQPTTQQLMPLPLPQYREFKKQKWDGPSIPMVAGDKRRVFQALIHEYFIVSLTHALTSSLAAEHYTRMMNMQQAEKNIDESLDEMNREYQQTRQAKITDELIDIVSGAESLKSASPLTKDAKQAKRKQPPRKEKK